MQNRVRVHLKRLNLPDDIQTLMFSFFENKKKAARDRTWRTWGSVWGTGSSCCRPTPSRTTTASRRPEWPRAPPPRQVCRFMEGVSKHSDAAADKNSSSVEKPAGKEGKIRNLCCCCVCLAALSASSLEGFHSRLINIEEIKTAAGFSLSCRLMSGK